VKRTILSPEHITLRDTARSFFERFAVPHRAEWEAQGHVGREIWKRAAEHGLLGLEIPEEYGGLGNQDYRFNALIIEESERTRSGVALTLQNEIISPYLVSLGNEEQKRRLLPGMAAGEILGSIGMSEPGAGSDLAGVRTSAVCDGDEWVINGSKTFNSGGLLADFIIVVARTDPSAGHKGFTLFLVETDRPGFARGKKLDKIGLRTSDTMELFFADVRVPDGNRLGEEGRGFYALMRNLPQERLGIAIGALVKAELAFELTVGYATDRQAFGQSIGKFQVNRHALSEMHTKLQVARTYLDQCILGVVDKTLTAEDAAGAKWWISELAWDVVDRCVQMFGGYGYINEYEIAQIWKDARVDRIHGGTTEIMKDLNGRKLGF